MMTSLDNIPLKTSPTQINDDSDDPLVKDILNEFNQEINNHPPQPQQQQQQSLPQQPINNNDYIINNPVSCPIKPRQTPQPKQLSSSLYNEDYIRKSAIIIIIVAFFFSPFIYDSIIEKLPLTFSTILTTYDFYFKLFIVYFIIYLFMIKNLL